MRAVGSEPSENVLLAAAGVEVVVRQVEGAGHAGIGTARLIRIGRAGIVSVQPAVGIRTQKIEPVYTALQAELHAVILANGFGYQEFLGIGSLAAVDGLGIASIAEARVADQV